MASYKSMGKAARSHSIHVAMERDYDRQKMIQKQELKYEKESQDLERKMASQFKSDYRIGNEILTKDNSQKRPSITLDEFMQRQRLKHDNINKSKQIANERIRHA